MVVRAALEKLRVVEVPTTLSPDGRTRPPHLRTWRDGWRHLKFLLIYCPRWLFLYPGVVLLALGVAVTGLLVPGTLWVGGIGFENKTFIAGGLCLLVGVQSVPSRFRSGATPRVKGICRDIGAMRRFLTI